MNGKILVVDDEKGIRELLVTAFGMKYEVQEAHNGEEALQIIPAFNPDLIILDIMMPKISGMGVAHWLRNRNIQIPIIFISAKDSTEDKVSGLEVGDDYLTKPFDFAELNARVEAILKRTKSQDLDNLSDQKLFVQDLEFDPELKEVSFQGNVIDFTPTEFEIFYLLAQNKGRIVSKEEILSTIWGDEKIDNFELLDTYISYIRKKLLSSTSKDIIETKRGIGFMIRNG